MAPQQRDPAGSPVSAVRGGACSSSVRQSFGALAVPPLGVLVLVIAGVSAAGWWVQSDQGRDQRQAGLVLQRPDWQQAQVRLGTGNWELWSSRRSPAWPNLVSEL